MRFLVFLILFFFSCQSEIIPLKKGDLKNISFLKAEMVGDTLNIVYQDNSLILFEEYHSLKSNVLVILNKEELKSYPVFKTVYVRSDRKYSLTKIYEQKDLTFVENLFENFPVFKDYAIHLTSKFDLNDWVNFRNAIAALNKSKKATPDEIVSFLFEFSIIPNAKVERSLIYKRLKTIGTMVKEVGLQDAFSDSGERKPPESFIKKMDYFFSCRNIDIPY